MNSFNILEEILKSEGTNILQWNKLLIQLKESKEK
jgi:hypothetical protein